MPIACRFPTDFQAQKVQKGKENQRFFNISLTKTAIEARQRQKKQGTPTFFQHFVDRDSNRSQTETDSEADGQKDRQTDRQPGNHADRQTKKQPERQTNGHANRQTDRNRCNNQSEEVALPKSEIKGWPCTALRAQYGQPKG